MKTYKVRGISCLILIPALLFCASIRADAVLSACVASNIEARGQSLSAFSLKKGSLEIHVSREASEKTLEVAKFLSNYMNRVFSYKPAIIQDGQQVEIWLGTADELNRCKVPPIHNAAKPAVSMYTHSKGLTLVTSSVDTLVPAAWHLMRELGYRQYFPGAIWEYFPKLTSINLEYNQTFEPGVASRHIWADWGFEHESIKNEYHDWVDKNSLNRVSKFALGHSYDQIYRDMQPVFEANKEWTTGEVSNTVKFCVSEDELIDAVIEWAKNKLRSDPKLSSITLDPSDGDDWDIGCEGDSNIGNGSPSDKVANAVTEEFDRKITITVLAYYKHNKPPSFELEDNVLVILTFGYYDGLNRSRLQKLWKNRIADRYAIYEYFCLEATYNHQPGRSQISSEEFLLRAHNDWIKLGVVGISAQSCDAFGPNGVNLYLAAGLMWLPKTAAVTTDSFVSKEKDLFFDNMFGEAQFQMRKFYELLENRKNRFRRTNVETMYSLIRESYKLTLSSEDITRRLLSLVIYTRYVELYQEYSTARGKRKQELFEEILTLVYRAKSTHMFHTRAIWASLGQFGAPVRHPDGFEWHNMNHPWKTNTSISNSEVIAWLMP